MATYVDLPSPLFVSTRNPDGTMTDAGGDITEQQLGYMFRALRGDTQGVINPGDLAVYSNTPANSQVWVAPGGAWVKGTSSPDVQGPYLCFLQAWELLDVPTASLSVDRWDIVVLRVLDLNFDGGPVPGVQYRGRVEYIQGDQDTGTIPNVPANSLLLAQVKCWHGATTVINAGDVTNLATGPEVVARRYNGGYLQQLEPTVWTKLELPTAEYDPQNGYDPTTWEWVVPATGYYRISGQCGVADYGQVNGVYIGTMLALNGYGFAWGAGAVPANWSGAVSASDEKHFTKGDRISVWGWFNNGGNIGWLYTAGGPAGCKLSLSKTNPY